MQHAIAVYDIAFAQIMGVTASGGRQDWQAGCLTCHPGSPHGCAGLCCEGPWWPRGGPWPAPPSRPWPGWTLLHTEEGSQGLVSNNCAGACRGCFVSRQALRGHFHKSRDPSQHHWRPICSTRKITEDRHSKHGQQADLGCHCQHSLLAVLCAFYAACCPSRPQLICYAHSNACAGALILSLLRRKVDKPSG